MSSIKPKMFAVGTGLSMLLALEAAVIIFA